MATSDPIIRFQFIPSLEMTEEDVDAVVAALRESGVDADVEESDRFIGVGEVTVILAIVVALAEAAEVIFNLVDRIQGKVGYTLDLRERPSKLTSNPGLPVGVVLVVSPDGGTKVIDKRNSSALKALQALLKLVAR